MIINRASCLFNLSAATMRPTMLFQGVAGELVSSCCDHIRSCLTQPVPSYGRSRPGFCARGAPTTGWLEEITQADIARGGQMLDFPHASYCFTDGSYCSDGHQSSLSINGAYGAAGAPDAPPVYSFTYLVENLSSARVSLTCLCLLTTAGLGLPVQPGRPPLCCALLDVDADVLVAVSYG
eukprot:2441246-Rhodomonas_salina.1